MDLNLNDDEKLTLSNWVKDEIFFIHDVLSNDTDYKENWEENLRILYSDDINKHFILYAKKKLLLDSKK